MKIKMTDNWKETIKWNYQNEGEHYYQFIKKCRQDREGYQSTIVFDIILKELEQIRKKGIVDYNKIKEDDWN